MIECLLCLHFPVRANSPVTRAFAGALAIIVVFPFFGFQAVCATACADEVPEPGFAQLRYEQEKSAFDVTRKWLVTHESSPEYPDAVEWLLDRSRHHGWYSESESITSLVLDLKRGSQKTQQLARRLAILAKAARQDDSALDGFRKELSQTRIREPNQMLEFAFTLCAQYQINGDAAAAREVLRVTSDAFFLNEQVRTICDRRMAKLLLLGKTAPEIAWKTVQKTSGGSTAPGEQTSLADLRGQIVLIDFWATNCAPCLADLPHLKQIWSRFSADRLTADRLTIVGLSLDRDPGVVRKFATDRNIRWPLALVTNSPADPREKYRVITIPSTFLLDREGKIVLVDGTARDVGLMLEKLTTGD